MGAIVIRFLAGGLLVSIFAALGEVIKPKSLAGIFGAAPSVALATLTLTAVLDGAAIVGTESRSMLLGALALAAYSLLMVQLLMRTRLRALTGALIALPVWFVTAFALWGLWLR